MSVTAAKAAARAEAARLLELFRAAGADPVECALLQPAETLLDLYGEDIRGRAFTTQGLDGEMMLRPDFTVPVVQMHMAEGRAPARYAYAGEIFRRQEDHPERPSEYLQAGFEIFGGDDRAAVDAEVFALIHGALAPLEPRIATGDIGILAAAVRGLSTSDRRKDALLRHIWRPRRFRTLLDRFSGRRPPLAHHQALAEAADPLEAAGPEIGRRTRGEVSARVDALREDLAEPPLAKAEVELIDDLLALSEPSDMALLRLRDLAVDMPAISAAVNGLERRLAALEGHGIAAADLPFETSHGRTTMEYYDGFVFSFALADRPDLSPLATGGRYDALTRILGERETPAVGGVIRPELTLLGAATC